MENHSKVPDEGTAPENIPETDEFLISVEDLMISVSDMWDTAPDAHHGALCNRLRVYGIYRGRVDLSSVTVRCKMWDHRECAETRVRDELTLVRCLLGEASTAFFAIVPVADFASDRISKRRYERAKAGGSVWYRWYVRNDGFVWVIASHPLTGRKAPEVFHETDAPMRWVAAALRLPGVIRADGSNVGQRTSDDDSHDEEFENQTVGNVYVYLGRATPSEKEELLRAAVAEVGHRFGIEIDILDPVKSNGGITWDQWAQSLKVVWDSR